MCSALERGLVAGMAPKVNLEATHIATLEFVGLDELQAHAATVSSEHNAHSRRKNSRATNLSVG